MPFRHEDFRSGRLLADIGPGEEATVVCTVERVRLRPTRRRNLAIVEAAIRDESGPGIAIWFNQRYLAKNLKPGMRLSLRGERRPTIGAEIVVKSHERAADDGEALHTSGLVPVYPASERVSSRRLVELVADVLAHAGDEVDPLPDGVKARRALPLRRDALHASHQPRDLAEARAAGRRLAYDELHLLQLGLLRRRARFEAEASARPLPAPGDLAAAFVAALPFELTGAQNRAVGEIDADLRRAVPMRRLLQGDVGSGKTAVAAYALVRAVEAGGQGALMAPTETLATQHLIGLAALCEPLGVRVVGLMQGMAARERRAAEGLLRSGEPARGGGDARADPGGRRLRSAARGRRRRAAPIRRRAAAGARGEGPGGAVAARAAHDGHPDPAHARALRLRRPRGVGARRAAGRAERRS